MEQYLVEKKMATVEVLDLAEETRERYRESDKEDRNRRERKYRERTRALARVRLWGMITKEEMERETAAAGNKKDARVALITQKDEENVDDVTRKLHGILEKAL